MGNVASTSITRTTNNGEVSEILEMTQEQFDQIVLLYGTGKRTEQKLIHHNEALARAQVAVFPNEELKEENFNRVNTDGFEKAVVLLKHWAEMTMREMFKKETSALKLPTMRKKERLTLRYTHLLKTGKLTLSRYI